MTYCNTLIDPLKERIEVEKKSLDTIAKELCGDTVKNPRQKVIRLIKILLGEDILIKNAETLGYDSKKAVRIAADHGKIVSEKEVVDSNNSGESNSVMPPISSCQTAVQPVNTEPVGEIGQPKGQEKVLEEPGACCRSSKAVRKVKKTDSDINEDDAGETTEPKKAVEDLRDAPEINVPNELIMEIKRLIGLYSLKDVQTALELAIMDI